jgi:hypothetical protein
MGQKELIEFCKENDFNYNKDASFKVLEPMWSIPKGIGGLGITESEFKNGFYVQIDTKGRKGFGHLEGKIFYFKIEKGWMQTELTLYNSHWKKYFIPLNDLDNWGKEVTNQVIEEPKLCDTYKEKNLAFAEVSDLQVIQEVENPVEEFPIVKESVETMFRLNHTWLKFRKGEKPTEKVDFTIFDGEEPFLFQVTKEQFSDLVDLMIEARKDLLK